MEVASKVRLVRCPKCGNILPEQPDFSVFQCGGCLSVLQAKSKEIPDSEFSEVSHEGERRGGVDEKGVVNVNSEGVIRNDVENDKYGMEEEGSQSEKSISNGHSTSRTEERGIMTYGVRTRQGEGMNDPRFTQGRRTAFNDIKDYRVNLRNSINDPAQRNQGDVDFNEVGYKFANSSLNNEVGGISPPARSRRTMSAINDWSMGRNGSAPSWRNGANSFQQGRFVKPQYSDEGPSNYEMSSYHGYGEQIRYPEGKDGLDRVAHLENDRAELLKKLDELTEKINKSGEMEQRHGERISSGRRPPTAPYPHPQHDVYMLEGSQFRFEKKDLHSDEYFPVPPNLNQGHGYAPSIQGPVLSSTDSYPPNHFRSPPAGYGDAYRPQLSRRHLSQPSHQYSQRAYMERFPNDRMAFNQDPFLSHPYETTTHPLASSSSHSMNRNWYGLPEIPDRIPSILRSRNDVTNVAPYFRSNSTAMGPDGYLSDGSHLHDQYQFTRPPRVMNYEKGNFHQRPRQVIVSRGASLYRPIAGGAPLIMCLHCFELLKIPVKVLLGTKQGKLKCGACSSIFVLECGTKGIVLSVSVEDSHGLEKIPYFSDDLPNENLQSAHDWTKNKVPFSVPKHTLEEQFSSSSEFEKRQSHHISRSMSENEESAANVIVRKDVSHPAKLPVEDDVLLRLEDSSHKGRSDPLQTDNSVNLYGEVNNAESMTNENSVVGHISSLQGSIKDSPVASEMDISVNDYINSGRTQDSTEVSKEGNKSKINKFAGIVKRSLKEFARSGHGTENVKSGVLINGHMIPDRLLKKAEKVAGPIQHGEYWYDYRAGFWGVMGHQCVGVIPPKIEEFNFPMPEDCSNGNTKVFVNGRELHEKDLNLLSRRGLSITRHKYYFVEITGKVVDEQTGEELESLGKLAPTVESLGRGFGMKIPKLIAQGP